MKRIQDCGRRRQQGAPLAGRFSFSALIIGIFVAFSLLAGCQQNPADFVSRFDEALGSDDPERVAALMTPASRELFWTMQITPAAPPPDPVTAVENKVGHAGFVPTKPKSPTRFVSAHRDISGLVLRVEAGDVQREWVVEERGGALLLDLLATSARSTWTGF